MQIRDTPGAWVYKCSNTTCFLIFTRKLSTSEKVQFRNLVSYSELDIHCGNHLGKQLRLLNKLLSFYMCVLSL